MTALNDIRVLEIAGPIAHYAGRQLADLGADVIKVELPAGDEARGYNPRIPGVSDPEASFRFVFLNANKRGVVLDYRTEAGRAAFLELVRTADVVLDSFQPAEAKALRLTHADLTSVRPDLIHTSVTGWGLSGPYADWAYADIVGCAMSGVMTLGGYPEGPPEQLPDFQGYTCASIDAVAGTVAAILHRQATDEGQLVEVAMQEALSMAQETAMQTFDILGTDRQRAGFHLGTVGIPLPASGIQQAADGWIYITAVGTAGAGFPGLLKWMRDEGAVQDLDEEPYASFSGMSIHRAQIVELLADPVKGPETQRFLDHIDDVVRAFCRAHPMRWLYEEGQRRRILVGMVSTPADIAASTQLAARDWYLELEDPGRGLNLRYPGFPWQMKGTPATLRRPAPLLGQHTTEVLAEAGLTPAAITALREQGVAK